MKQIVVQELANIWTMTDIADFTTSAMTPLLIDSKCFVVTLVVIVKQVESAPRASIVYDIPKGDETIAKIAKSRNVFSSFSNFELANK